MNLSIRVTNDEHALLSSYANMHAITISEAVKRAVFERIEDEFDIRVGEEAYQEYVADGKKSRPISELWEELGL